MLIPARIFPGNWKCGNKKDAEKKIPDITRFPGTGNGKDIPQKSSFKDDDFNHRYLIKLDHRHLRKIDWYMACTACFVCLISNVSGRSKKS